MQSGSAAAAAGRRGEALLQGWEAALESLQLILLLLLEPAASQYTALILQYCMLTVSSRVIRVRTGTSKKDEHTEKGGKQTVQCRSQGRSLTRSLAVPTTGQCTKCACPAAEHCRIHFTAAVS